MINPIQQPGTGETQGAGRNTSAGAARATSSGKAAASSTSVLPSQDSVEVSSFSREVESYSQMLKTLPDVRPDVVANAREATQPSIKYPPLDIIAGIGALIGTNLKAVNVEAYKETMNRPPNPADTANQG